MPIMENTTQPAVDVAGLLKEDHDKVKELFERFEQAEERRDKQQIVDAALRYLTVHAQIEEEIVYPAFRQAQGEDEEAEELMDEALQEHHVAKFLIAELEDMSAGDDFFDAKFKVLAESVKHHIEEEESEVLPKIDEDDEMWSEVGREVMDRRNELIQGRSKGSTNNGSRASSGRGRRTKSQRKTRKARKAGGRGSGRSTSQRSSAKRRQGQKRSKRGSSRSR